MVDLRRVRQALAESDAQRQALLDSALDCVICTDSKTRITEFNATAERTFRISRPDALGEDLADTILPPELRDRHRGELFQSTATGGLDVIGNRLETRAMRSDGTEFPAELTVSRVAISKQVTFTVYVRDISARKRVEEAVVRLAAIVESSQDAIYGADLDGHLSSWNKGAELMYGYSADEVIGKHVSILIPPGHRSELPLVKKTLLGGRGTHDFEAIRRTKDGKLLHVSLTVSPVRDSNANLIGVSAIARDMTARKAAEEALRKATETSVYASPVPIVASDTSGCITMWNPAAEQVFGWSEKEVLGKPNPTVPANETRNVERLNDRLLSGETLTGVEGQRQKRDGSLVTISLSGTPVWDEARKVKGTIKFLTDITERKRAEEALRKAEEKYRGIFENALDGIYQTTRDGKYLSANPALARMLGFDSPEDLIAARQGIGNGEFITPGLHAEFIQLLEQFGAVHNFEYQAHRKDGKIVWISENARAVKDPEGKTLYFEGTAQNITQQRELEQQVRQMQKIEAIGRLAGGVAHDFNNILMAVSSFAELLHRKLPEENRKYIDEILKATNRGSSLTQGLLAFSRKQVISPKVVDLNTLIAEQSHMLKRLITENIELKFIPDPAVGRVKVDPGQIEQVVMNLVINARDAMSNGGELVIETANSELDQTSGRSQYPALYGEYVMLAVSDNGCGMDDETQSRIFEPFFTTKEQGRGTGLGLATVFGIVKQSAGHIFVQSELGHGTTFRIYLPRVEEAVEFTVSKASDDSFRGNETILLVEDEEAVRTSAAEYLVENGYTVLIASKGPDALQIADQYREPIHLLLTDLVMPKMSGRELAERIQQTRSETRVVFMSGYSRNLLSSEQVLDPKHVLLQKPFRLVDLGRRIREVLTRKNVAAAGQ